MWQLGYDNAVSTPVGRMHRVYLLIVFNAVTISIPVGMTLSLGEIYLARRSRAERV